MTEAVLNHHLEAFDSGNVETILSDYAPDALLLTPTGTLHGHAQIRPVLQSLLKDIFQSATQFTMLQQIVEGELAYIVWSAESDRYRVPLATDTYLIRGGKIVIQTFTAQMEAKA
ncbi:MAG: nuclear transport factor 2 family protein [Bacillota bacterium]